MAEVYRLGIDAKAYIGETGANLSNMAELSNITDVTLTLEAGEADITTRANSGWRATAATLRECSVEFEMQWKPDDENFTDMQEAFLASTTVELAFLTGPKADEGSEGPKGSFSITRFSRNEALEEAIKVSVAVKLAAWDQFVSI